MTAPLDDHVLQARNLHERYHLSENVLELFRAYGEHHSGVESPEALGRRLRTSTLMRTCTDTISSVAMAMQKNPTPECMAECNEIIACCTDMLNIANESSQDKVLPFMKLPVELRQMVYQYYFKNLLLTHPSAQGRIISNHANGCHCYLGNLKSYTKEWGVPLEMPLIYTCSHIRDEALKVWFEDRLFTFACGCELSHCLQINKNMEYHLRNVKVHWRGGQSDSAFKLLQEAPKLKKLVVVISRDTTLSRSGMGKLLAKYWSSRRRIPEALGFDELAKLVEERRPESVKVEHVERFQAHRRSERDRSSLEQLLSDLGEGSTLEDSPKAEKRKAVKRSPSTGDGDDDDDDWW